MNRNKYLRLSALSLMILLLMTLQVSIAQDNLEPVPLVPITVQNATQLEPWIPIGQNSQPSQEWIPVARGTLGGISHSPTDNLIAVGSSTGLYLFDTNNLHKEPVHVDGIDESVGGIFSSDGMKIALQTSSQKLYIYSLVTLKLVQLASVPATDRYSGLQFSDDGSHIFAAAYEKGNSYRIAEWEAETGKHLSTFELPEISEYINNNQPYQLSVPFLVSADRYITYHPLAVSISNTTTVIQSWDSDTHGELLKINLPVETSWLNYSAGQNVFVTSGYQNNYQGALVWDASTGSRIAIISTSGRPYLSSDASAIWFSDGGTSVIRVWDIKSRRFTQEYGFETGQSLSFVSNNHLISSDSRGTINVWQLDDVTFTKADSIQAFTGSAGDVIFTSKGDELIVAFGRAGMQVWATNSWTTKNFIAVEKSIGAMAISPDNQSIAVAIGDYAPGEKLRFYELATGAILASATYPQTINSLAYHPTGDYIAAGRSGGFDLALYSTRSATVLSRFSEGGIPYSVAFSPDGTLLASGNADMNVRVYNTATRQSEYVLETGGSVRSLAFSHDGSLLATGTGKLALYDAETGKQIYASDYLGEDINDMAFSPDDSLLATVSSKRFILWDVASRRLLWEQEIDSYYPHVAFHPDGNLIAVSHSSITLWVVNTGADGDKDGVDDIRDACPIQAGEVNGCPDSDSDGVIDISDVCPTEPGTVRGCPDTDEDGVANPDDLCPQEIGNVAANGCPDKDTDGIIDSEDLCPSTTGVAQFKGCPDTDSDNIADTDDVCPQYAGIPENNGCPQKGHTNTNANIRISASATGTIVRSISPSEEFYIIGRNAAGDWLQIVLDPDGDPVIAWVFQSLTVTDIEISTLPIQE